MLKRISFFQKNLLLSSIFTLLIGVTLIASSYYIEGKVINETLESQGVGLGELLASELDSEQVLKTIPVLDPAAPEQVPMIAFLDRISAKNTNVAQAYVFKKDRQENGLFTAISVPTSLIEVGATPGVDMPDAPPFVEAYDKAMATKKAAASSTYSDDYGTWFTVITPILDKNGEIAAFFGVDMSAAIIKNSQISMVQSLAIALIVLFVILFAVQYFNLKRIMAPIKDLSDAVNEVSSGNLEVELKVTTHDEIGTVAMGFNGMVKKIRDNMKELETATHQILHTFSQVASVTDNTNEQASNILASLEEITTTTDYLAGEAERGNHQLIDMNSKIEIILTHTSEAATSITGCLHQSDEGIDIIEALKDKFSETEVITLQVGQKIYGLESRMRRINDLLNSIQDVAEQTGLLSLNASIEAARAGEHGRGFSVVAEEIRKLSTNSKQASEEIASLLKMISQDVDSTGQEMRVAETSLKEQSKHVEKTISSFYQIRDHIQAVVNSIQKVDQTIQIVEQNKETLLETVESVSSMAEETAASVELIQRNFSEQVSSIQELNESCHQMNTKKA